MIFKITNSEERMAAIRALNDAALPVVMELSKLPGTRSLSQNSALHASLRTLSDVLNDAGLSMNVVLNEGVEIEWNEKAVKQYLFHPIMKAITGKESSAKLNKIEMTEVYDAMMLHLGQKTGVYVPFVKG